jgi:hypothetical protein
MRYETLLRHDSGQLSGVNYLGQSARQVNKRVLPINGDSEVLRQMQQALLKPIFTVSIVFSVESINTTQPAPAHTPQGDVIVHWIAGINQLMLGVAMC